MSKDKSFEMIPQAVAALQRGELVALPTETVYGLGADATNASAVRKIFAAKGRPADHPLIVHLAEETPLENFAVDVPDAAHLLIAKFWPGPLALILKRGKRIPTAVTGGQETVGLRCPAHPLAQALLSAFARVGSGVIAAPSANRFGHVSPTSAAHVRDEFGAAVGKEIFLLDGGKCAVGIESTIIDLSRGRPVLLRPGAISREQLAAVLGENPLLPGESDGRIGPDAPRVSGSLAAHYAPMTPLRLVAGTQLQSEIDAVLDQGKRVAVLAFSAKAKVKPSPVGVGVRNARALVWISAEANPADYAHMLYANLRTLDAAATAVILVEATPGTPAWDAVNDRLGRAAAGSGQRPPQ